MVKKLKYLFFECFRILKRVTKQDYVSSRMRKDEKDYCIFFI